MEQCVNLDLDLGNPSKQDPEELGAKGSGAMYGELLREYVQKLLPAGTEQLLPTGTDVWVQLGTGAHMNAHTSGGAAPVDAATGTGNDRASK